MNRPKSARLSSMSSRRIGLAELESLCRTAAQEAVIVALGAVLLAAVAVSLHEGVAVPGLLVGVAAGSAGGSIYLALLVRRLRVQVSRMLELEARDG